MKNTDDELGKDMPLLSELRNQKEPFRTPEGYFDDFEDALMSRIQESGISRQAMAHAPMRARRFSITRVWMAAAAAVLVLLAGIWFVKPFSSPNSESDAAQALASYQKVDISGEEAEAWLSENVHEFDAKDLASLPDVSMETPVEHPIKKKKNEIRTEDVESILDQLSEEEIEELL